MLAIDISSYAGAPSVETFEAMTDVGLVIVAGKMSVTQNPYAEAALANARAAGKLTATYAWLRGDHYGSWAVEAAREACGDEWEHCLFCAVDCEDEGVTVETIQEAIDELGVSRKANALVVYTGPAWWASRIGVTHPFGANTALWYATYDGDPTIGLPDLGWPVAQGKQYQQNVAIHGVNTDLSTFRDEWIAQITQPSGGGSSMDIEKLRAALDVFWTARTILTGNNEATEAASLERRLRNYSRELRELHHGEYADALTATANELKQQGAELLRAIIEAKVAAGLQAEGE